MSRSLSLHPGVPFKLFGAAGTGKTTMARDLASGAKAPLFLAYTGKAAARMRECGCPKARTIHSALYQAHQTRSGVVFDFAPVPELLAADLVVVDECSMCPKDLADDLLRANPKARYLVLGDPCQLPPLNPENAPFYGKPDMLLTTVHRQALDSPILAYATEIRERMSADVAVPSCFTAPLADVKRIQADIVLVGKNQTRHALNKFFAKDQDNPPLVVLQNNKKLGLFNGEIFPQNELQCKGRLVFETQLPKPQWKPGHIQVGLGYAITVHKAQGSQWEHVAILAKEASCFREMGWRWLYTGVTRACTRLTVLI